MNTTMIIVTGIPGSGKTTILEEAVKVRHNLKILNYGDEMMQVAAGQNIQRDLLRTLPIFEQRAIGLLAAQRILGQAKGITIIDTHALIKMSIGYMPGIPQNILNVLNPNAIIFIESHPEVILKRREKGLCHSGQSDTIEEIEYHQTLSRTFITSCSLISGAMIIPIQNNTDTSLAVNQLIHVLNFLIQKE